MSSSSVIEGEWAFDATDEESRKLECFFESGMEINLPFRYPIKAFGQARDIF